MLRDALSVILPGSQDLDKAFVPFFPLQDQQKCRQQIQGIWDREGRRSENTQRGGDTVPFAPPGCAETQPYLELPIWGQKHEAPQEGKAELRGAVITRCCNCL